MPARAAASAVFDVEANRANQSRQGDGPGAGLIQDTDIAVWTRKARNFIAFSVILSAVAGVIALIAGIIVHSAALVAYGLESFVDLWASVLVLWRFWDDEDTEAGMRRNHDREARANVGIAFTFVAIAIITAGQAISHLAHHKFPEDSTPILVFSVISIVTLTAMSVYKMYLNKHIQSKALEMDAVASFAVSALSMGILVSAALYQVNKNIWWLDAVVALVITILLAIYSVPILIQNSWWRKDFWAPYAGPFTS